MHIENEDIYVTLTRLGLQPAAEVENSDFNDDNMYSRKEKN